MLDDVRLIGPSTHLASAVATALHDDHPLGAVVHLDYHTLAMHWNQPPACATPTPIRRVWLKSARRYILVGGNPSK